MSMYSTSPGPIRNVLGSTPATAPAESAGPLGFTLGGSGVIGDGVVGDTWVPVGGWFPCFWANNDPHTKTGNNSRSTNTCFSNTSKTPREAPLMVNHFTAYKLLGCRPCYYRLKQRLSTVALVL